ncbi:hypothetical protein CCACVL1_04427 [Corchorus capsularis]|uniref:Uncharacterized protein n=1 Tax=Corchorus capsularis TaxID=210143 RepID=A0A1R3JSU5_COCAP|nr:hypothetical protein CCACVL1_04427 [Corchorus capsularis]
MKAFCTQGIASHPILETFSPGTEIIQLEVIENSYTFEGDQKETHNLEAENILQAQLRIKTTAKLSSGTYSNAIWNAGKHKQPPICDFAIQRAN